MKEQVLEFIAKASTAITANSKKAYPTCAANHMRLVAKPGRKYVKVMIESLEGHHRSVYCFIDMEGNIYKAATFNAPAKGIRSHILRADVTKMDSSTYWLYR